MNTLKFGNGEWYGKKDTILAYNDENSNFKPLPFSFDRASSATRVNKDGLIETVGSGEPRIDYKDDSKGALLLEPTRSNLITYSEDFTQWSDAGTPTVVLSSSLAPNGYLDAYDITDNSSGVYEIKRSNSASFDGTYTMSIFVKKTTGALTHYAGVQFIGLSDYLIIDTTNGTVNQTASEYSNIKVEDFSNWWKISATGTNTGSTFLINLWAAISSNGTSLSPSAVGTNTFFGAQLEQGSYATSYIPTQGAISTKVAEICNGAGNNQVFNDSDGAIFLNFASYGDYVISLDNGTSTNRIQFFRTSTNDRIYIMIGGTFIINEIYRGTSNGVYNKYALSYESGNILLYVNGSLLRTYTTPFTSTPFSEFRLNQYDNNASVSLSLLEAKIYNTRLTNAELQALTSN